MPILDLFGMVFEWHDDKFELVHQNRGVSLEEVASVFFDDYSIDKDDFGDYDEQRTLTIGMSNVSPRPHPIAEVAKHVVAAHQSGYQDALADVSAHLPNTHTGQAHSI